MNAYIFACNIETIGECLARNLFGVWDSYVSDISPGDFCYLYNFDTAELYGLWKATSGCGWHIREAWGGKFRKQARVQLVSKTPQAIPINSVRYLIEIGGNRTWKLYGDRAQQLLQYFASEYAGMIDTGRELTRLEQDYRLRYPVNYICEDGHRVRSLSEKTVDDWLFRNRFVHRYEPVVPIPEEIIPDFEVSTKDGGSVYIEFWGMVDDPVYKERMNKKIQVYFQRRLPLIELRQEDLQNLDFELRRKLANKNVAVWR
jgi:hypothetical protein